MRVFVCGYFTLENNIGLSVLYFRIMLNKLGCVMEKKKIIGGDNHES